MSDVLSFAAATAMAGSGATLQRCKLVLLQLASQQRNSDVATRIIATLLQQRCGVASARFVATLKQVSWEHCSAVANS